MTPSSSPQTHFHRTTSWWTPRLKRHWRWVYEWRLETTPLLLVLPMDTQVQRLQHASLDLHLTTQGPMPHQQTIQHVLGQPSRDMSVQGTSSKESCEESQNDEYQKLGSCGMFLLGGGWCYASRTCDLTHGLVTHTDSCTIWLIVICLNLYTSDSLWLMSNWLLWLTIALSHYDSFWVRLLVYIVRSR